MDTFLSGIVGVIVGGLITGFFHIWKLYRDDLSARIDEICEIALLLNESATSYWLERYDVLAKQRAAETKIISQNTLLDGLITSLLPRLTVSDSSKLKSVLSQLSDAVSGGAFSEFGRPEDHQRAMKLPNIISSIIVLFREAHDRSMPLNGLARARRDNMHRP
jgi:hypothetical protein